MPYLISNYNPIPATQTSIVVRGYGFANGGTITYSQTDGENTISSIVVGSNQVTINYNAPPATAGYRRVILTFNTIWHTCLSGVTRCDTGGTYIGFIGSFISALLRLLDFLICLLKSNLMVFLMLIFLLLLAGISTGCEAFYGTLGDGKASVWRHHRYWKWLLRNYNCRKPESRICIVHRQLSNFRRN
jgi:hypothetical protein